jgi:hypothetical protein
VEPGQAVTVSGSGYPPNTPLEVLLLSDPVLLGTTTTDASGRFAVVVTIPIITVFSRAAQVGFLARTGSDPRAFLRVAFVLFGAGAALLALGKHRPRRTRRPWN